MDELENPYRPGAGTRPPALIGRDALIERFGVTIRRAMSGRPGKSVMPIGLRGVGKTVLLNRFTEIADQEGYAVGYIEAPESGDLPRLLALRLRSILLALDRGPVERAVRRALRVLKSFAIQLPDGSSIRIDVDALTGEGDSGDLTVDVVDLLVAVGEAARARETGVLIAVDEVQYLSSAELAALITAVHRTNQLNLPIVLVGAGLPQLPGLAGEAKSYAERLFEFPEIGPLAAQEARDALSIPGEAAGVAFEPAALDLIVPAAHGYPYFLQEWGYHVWNRAETSLIRRGDVERAAPEVERHLDANFFLVRFERLTPKERQYLRAMAELGPGPHRSGDIAAQLGVRVESVAPRRSALIAKGMVYSPAHGDTAFTVPLFDDFLRRTLSQPA
jgi:hypothetical protein